MPANSSKSLFIAVGEQGARITSADGKKWSAEQTGKEGEVYRAVAFGNGRYVAVGTFGGKNIFASSADGQKWETSSKDGKYSMYVRGVGFGKEAFLGIGGDPGAVGSSAPFVLTTPDGVTWSDYIKISGKNIIRRIAWGKDRFVGVGDRGRRSMSKDGVQWEDAPGTKAIDTLIDIAYGGPENRGIFVGVGLHGLRMTSIDGLKWSERIPGEEGEHLNSIVWADNRFVAIGAGGTYTSPDGVKWAREANKDAPTTAAYGNGVFVGASWKGKLLRSTNGVHWEQVYKGENNFEAVAFG
jgi:photosystem II stability/assembly factor-like uncharacterized protein